MARETAAEKNIKKIEESTIADMTAIGTYRPEFKSAIRRYAEMRHQYDILTKQFYKGGCKVAEEYTNKAGATNIRKTALYLSLETLRKDIVEHENLLGLTPAGLKKVSSNRNKPQKKVGKLGAVMGQIGQQQT